MTQTNDPTFERVMGALVGIPKQPNGRLDPSRLEIAVEYSFMIVSWHLDEETAL